MWAGGKTRMIKKYKDYLPSSFLSYVEPFVGAGAMFVWAYQKNPDAKFVLNDYNESIMNIYSAIRNEKMEQYRGSSNTIFFNENWF